MHVDTSYSTQNGKTYCRHLLRESYREGGKVKHRTIANLSACSEDEIAAIKLALRHKGDLSALGSIEDISMEQGLRIGAVFSLYSVARHLGVNDALGSDRNGKLALWQVMARLMDQGSRLSAVRLAQSHAACDVLGLDTFNEDHLYANLAWLTNNQEIIEKRLFQRNFGSGIPNLFLYDVTSSYLEGVMNELAYFGYNRDGKKGKEQIVIGLLTGPDGTPVSVRVFDGNTQDPKTVPEQIRTLAHSLGVKHVTLVGDRGMLKSPQLKALSDEQFHYITAITKAQISTFVKSGVFQMALFEQELGEVEHEGVRYVLRRNPERAKELKQSRWDKLVSLQEFVNERNRYLKEHSKAKVGVAEKNAIDISIKFKISEWAKVVIRNGFLELEIDHKVWESKELLDGCYAVKTDLPIDAGTAQTIHDRYKDLALVERAFRTFKNGHLEIQPAFVRTEESTRGHVFVVMLAYLIERELERCWRQMDITVQEGIDELGSLRGINITIGKAACQKVPKPAGMSANLLAAIGVRLPEVFPSRKVSVATRKRLYKNRK